MNTDVLMREHLESRAQEVALTPAGSDAVMRRVHRTKTMARLAVAAAVVAIVGIVMTSTASTEQDPVGAPSSSTGDVAASSWNHIVVSPDAGAVIQIIASRSGGFILLTENQRWFYSDSGDTWVERVPVGFGPQARIQMIANVGDRLVAAGTSIDGNPLVATSLDGIEWEGALPGDAGVWLPVSIAVTDDTVLVPFLNYDSFDTVVFRFTVGDLWTVALSPEPGTQILTIGALDGGFVAQVIDPSDPSRRRDYRSDDGLVWQRREPMPAFQVNRPLTRPIVQGPTGSYLVSWSPEGGERLMRSLDGSTWEPAIDTIFEFGPSSLVAGEYGLVAALPINDKPGTGAIVGILYSPDGESWTAENLGPDFARTSRWVELASDQRRIVVGGGTFEAGSSRDAARTEVWIADR